MQAVFWNLILGIVPSLEESSKMVANDIPRTSDSIIIVMECSH